MIKVSFGIINCNRLFYFKSQYYSLLHCLKDYKEKEIIVIDNCSVEPGTKEFLDEIEQSGHKVIRQTARDYSNEFAKALNIFCREAKGKFLAPLQGDTQIIINGKEWLEEYVNFFEDNLDQVGAITLDAQREETNMGNKFSVPYGKDFKLCANFSKKIPCAGDVVYSRKFIEEVMFPWEENNLNHEGGQDSETEMVNKVKNYLEVNSKKMFCVSPVIPVSATIYTDRRGTNARVRANKRYGSYWPAKEDFKYYKIHEYKDLIEKYKSRTTPVSIEEIVEPIGFEKPLDSFNRWMKNPIRPEFAAKEDYVVLDEVIESVIEETHKRKEDDFVDEWLNS